MPRALVLFSAARPPADNEVRTLVLPHPRGEPALFARSGNALVELQRAESDHGAWFVDDAAHAGAGVVVATPYDARLSLLSVLTTSATRRQFVPLEQIVAAAGHEGLRCLLDLDLGPLGAFCDEKDLGDGLRLVRLAEAPTVVDWLHGKVRRVAAVVDAAAAAETVGASDAFVAASAGAPATAAVGPSLRMRAAAASQRAQTSLNSRSIFRARPSGAVTRNVAGSGFLKVAIMRRHSSSSRPSCCL